MHRNVHMQEESSAGLSLKAATSLVPSRMSAQVSAVGLEASNAPQLS